MINSTQTPLIHVWNKLPYAKENKMFEKLKSKISHLCPCNLFVISTVLLLFLLGYMYYILAIKMAADGMVLTPDFIWEGMEGPFLLVVSTIIFAAAYCFFDKYKVKIEKRKQI